ARDRNEAADRRIRRRFVLCENVYSLAGVRILIALVIRRLQEKSVPSPRRYNARGPHLLAFMRRHDPVALDRRDREIFLCEGALLPEGKDGGREGRQKEDLSHKELLNIVPALDDRLCVDGN